MDKNCVELIDPNGRIVRVLRKDVEKYLTREGWSSAEEQIQDEPNQDDSIQDGSEPGEDVSLSGEVTMNGDVGIGDLPVDPSEE
jgi:hypothetical protein